MNPRKYRVAVILINYNSSQFTINCVASIREQTASSLRYQIIIIDNNSRPEEFEKLKAIPLDDTIQVWQHKLNVGFSAGNMMGVQLADADYYYFLNNDCLLYNDCLSILTSFMDSEIQAGNCSGEMLNEAGEYESVFGYFPSLALKLLGSGFLRVIYPHSFPNKYERYKKPLLVDRVSGSAMFIRAKVFEAIGGFDVIYFLFCEEEDIALRLKRAGYYTYLVPQARYQHLANKSSTETDKINFALLKEYFISLNYYFKKNYSSPHAFGIRVVFFSKYLLKGLKNWRYIKLAFFVFGGAPIHSSLRFKQAMRS